MKDLRTLIASRTLWLACGLALVGVGPAAGQTNIYPTAPVDIAAADDYATRALQDPWDMSERTDLGWFTFGVDNPPSNLSNISFANGIFSATPTTNDPNLWLLDTPMPGTVQNARDGRTFPIDGSKYRMLLIRMKQAVETSDPNSQYAQVLWSNNTLYGGMNSSGAITAHGGWWIYQVDLPALGVVSGSPWPGTATMVDSVRFDPTQTTASGTLQVDWVRLVDNSNGALRQTITWSGGSYNIFLSSNAVCSAAESYSRVTGSPVASGAYQVYVGGLPPGDWYVGLGTGSVPQYCSGGFFRVAGVPTMTFTSPSEEGSSDDFATVQLNNAWDFADVDSFCQQGSVCSAGDVDYYRNITGLGKTAIAAETEGGVSLGAVNVLSGTSAPAPGGSVGDPYIYTMWSTARGAKYRIDANRYRILTFEMSLPRTRDLNLGSIARVVWKIAGESTENKTREIILHHLDPAANGGVSVMQKIILDLADRTKVPLVAGPALSQSGWTNGSSPNPGLDNFRIHLHEFSNPTAFFVRRAKLAAFEKADSSYTLRLSAANLPSTATTVSFFDDPDQSGFNGTAIVGSGCQNATLAASAQCSWNTGSLANGSLHYVYAVVRSGATVVNQTYAKWPVVIDHSFNANAPTLAPDKRVLYFKAATGGARTSSQTVTLSQTGGSSPVNWTATVSGPAPDWFVLSRNSGSGTGTIDVSLNPAITSWPWSDTNTLVITAAGTVNSPQYVKLRFDAALTPTAGPIAFFDTPVSGSVVTGAIGVTGWAVDDVGIASVRILRNCLVGIDNPPSCGSVGGRNLVFIGNGPFLAGARPDVEAVYPTYPFAYKAGWGMQVLTNMLPHIPRGTAAGGGQGTMELYAHVRDLDGHEVLLGPKTIVANNDAGDRPFGTIDTPPLDSTLSGTVVNFGWALTPGSAIIPTDGSTMNVVIDGVAVGKVAYNQCRGTVGNPVEPGRYCNDDIASIFGNTTPMPTFTPRTSNPSIYRNLDAGRGAIGAYVINTTALTNGLHTLAWGVIDDNGRNDGLGSRFFTVLNGSYLTAESAGASRLALSDAPARVLGDAAELAWRSISPSDLSGRTGFNFDAPLEAIAPDGAGVRHVRLPELGRLELSLGDEVRTGYLRANGTLRPLPPGSRLDPENGLFTWAPGPGYIGTYDLVFLQGEAQVPLSVTIQPKTAAATGRMRGYVDLPAVSAIVSGTFTVAGWALDLDAWQGSGVGAVHVWAQRRDAPAVAPVFLGAADLGGLRLDVGVQFGSQFDRTGWGLTASDLAPGVYNVTAYFWSTRTGRFEDARTVSVTVR